MVFRDQANGVAHVANAMPMPLPELHAIDVASYDGGDLFEALNARSPRIAAVASTLPSRVFRLKSPWAPGTWFVGAEAPLWAGVPVGASGSGTTHVDALVSCLGELIERVSQVEQPGDVSSTTALNAGASGLLPQAKALIEDIAATNAQSETQLIDWVDARDLRRGTATRLPADWCIRRKVGGPLCMAGTALSTGVAAGATADAAALRALLELVERDAVAQWWVGGRCGCPLALGPDQAASIDAFVTAMRQGVDSRCHWLLDVSSDIAIPVVVAVSVDKDGKGFASGMAARLDAAEAARAALFEMFQMELALLVVELKRRQRGDAALNVVDRQHVARSTLIDAAACDLLHPAGAARAWPVWPNDQPVQLGLLHITTVIADAGIEAVRVNLERAKFGVPVVATFAPALQRYPSNHLSKRLRQAINDTGGGARWTKQIPIC